MTTDDDIRRLEQQLRRAELGPDAAFFEKHLADDVILDGARGMKETVVAAHQSDGTAKFSKVEMSDLFIVDHGDAAVVTCTGTYEGAKGPFTLKFMRVWIKRAGRWQIIAGTTSPVP